MGPKLLIRWYLYKPTLVCLSGYVYQTVRDAPLSAAVRLSIIVAAFTALMGLNEKQKYFSLNSQQYGKVRTNFAKMKTLLRHHV
jgi:hypothetical protein